MSEKEEDSAVMEKSSTTSPPASEPEEAAVIVGNAADPSTTATTATTTTAAAAESSTPKATTAAKAKSTPPPVCLKAYKRDRQQQQERQSSFAARSRTTTSSRVGFRSLNPTKDEDGSYVDIRHKEITFADADTSSYDNDNNHSSHNVNRSTTELHSYSKLSLTILDSTLPMAYDNQRFFDDDEGYALLLSEAMVKLKDQRHHGRPTQRHYDGIVSWLLGLLWRWLLRLSLQWTSDPINRLRLTRGSPIPDHLHFSSAYEAYVLGKVMQAYDYHPDSASSSSNKEARTVAAQTVALAFQHQTVSRLLLRTVLTRWDWVWHDHTQVRKSRLLDVLAHVPFVGGYFSFGGTENSPGSFYSWRSTVRRVLDVLWLKLTASWRSRRRRQDNHRHRTHKLDPYLAAQNLAAEATGLEAENRSIHGTYFGRQHTNAFRLEHRLTTDESIVRTFMTSPSSTMINNGAEHVLATLARHWQNMLYQDNGNFAHQRLELLNPFETLRFHVPQVLQTLANLRGRNVWDESVLGPFMEELQSLDPGRVSKTSSKKKQDFEQQHLLDAEIVGPCQAGKRLVERLKAAVVDKVCAGIPARAEALALWLSAIAEAFLRLLEEAKAVRDFVANVDIGIGIGYQLMGTIDWQIPSDRVLRRAIVEYILNSSNGQTEVEPATVGSALQKLAPKDERTLKQLMVQGYRKTEAAKQLLARAVKLLEREARRKTVDDRIRELSVGPIIQVEDLERSRWYWIDAGQGLRVAMFSRPTLNDRLKFVEVDTNSPVRHDRSIKCYKYIPVAEAISRAQKAFMTVELDFCKRFAYNTFMEFGHPTAATSLRLRLRRLAVLSQLHSSELDQARLSLLAEIKLSLKSSRKAKLSQSRVVPDCRPQNTLVIGGGPTGLLCAIHAAQNVILSGGEIKVYEGRDEFYSAGATFERAQIVRLDARQIAMLRYHLGTAFEDVFIPLRGETQAHIGNTIPSDGFVEVTIKRLESMLLDELINIRSKNLCDFFGGSKISCDVKASTFTKQGSALKVGDVVYRASDTGELTVQSFVYESNVRSEDLVEGCSYDVLARNLKSTSTDRTAEFELLLKDSENDWYEFIDKATGSKRLNGCFSELPPIYKKGCGRSDPKAIVVSVNGEGREELDYDEVENKDFYLDVSKSHVVVARGKPAGSTSHFKVTSGEPYVVCCIEGLKISMGMHKFGNIRFSSIVDDWRTRFGDSNTRLVGDFTKSVSLHDSINVFYEKMASDPSWMYQFDNVSDSILGLHKQLLGETKKLRSNTNFRRMYLQVRFFELGNNYYLGMELSREFSSWKKSTIDVVASELPSPVPVQAKEERVGVRKVLPHLLDRLWCEAVIEVLSVGDIYNRGGRMRIPRIFTIDSPFPTELGALDIYEAFTMSDQDYQILAHDGESGLTTIGGNKLKPVELSSQSAIPNGRLRDLAIGSAFRLIDSFEVISKGYKFSVVRNSSGFVNRIPHSVSVKRLSDLARSPDGYSESSVALASFDVAHVVCHRTLYVNRASTKSGEDGFITTFVGDAQASPHFMRYSGLTGASINCMSFNNLISQALKGVTFEDRIQRFAFETNWSNGEVVQRGVGHGYGEDGFLRPSFSYRNLIAYLYDRAVEQREIGSLHSPLLSRDWKVKIAAAIVPRGLETDLLFYESLVTQLQVEIRKKYETVFRQEMDGEFSALVNSVMEHEIEVLNKRWSAKDDHILGAAKMEVDERLRRLKDTTVTFNIVVEGLLSVLHYAVELRSHGDRISSESVNQPQPVDALIDTFGAEAQHTAITLSNSVAYMSAAVALSLLDERKAVVLCILLAIWNVSLSTDIISEVYRYKKRNEESICTFFRDKLNQVSKAIFSTIAKENRSATQDERDPFVLDVNRRVEMFLTNANYYSVSNSTLSSFRLAFAHYIVAAREETNTLQFMRHILSESIPSVFHQSSYLQEDLVAVVDALQNILKLSRMVQEQERDTKDSGALFGDVVHLQNLFELFIESKSAVLRNTFHVDRRMLFYARDAMKKLDMLSSKTAGMSKHFKYALRDLDELTHAIKEKQRSAVTCLALGLIVVSSGVIVISKLFALLNVEDTWTKAALNVFRWMALGAVLGAYLSASYFLQKLKYLSKLDSFLQRQPKNPHSGLIRSVVWSQVVVTVIELVGLLASSLTLPWSVSTTVWEVNTAWETYPIYLALSSVVLSILSSLAFDVLEFTIRYRLDPALGRVVCALGRNQIVDIKASYPELSNTDFKSRAEQDSKASLYLMKEFLQHNRFDVVFGADRFGTLVHQLQGERA